MSRYKTFRFVQLCAFNQRHAYLHLCHSHAFKPHNDVFRECHPRNSTWILSHFLAFTNKYLKKASPHSTTLHRPHKIHIAAALRWHKQINKTEFAPLFLWSNCICRGCDRKTEVNSKLDIVFASGIMIIRMCVSFSLRSLCLFYSY